MPRLSSIGSKTLAGIGLNIITTILPETFYYPLTNSATDPTSANWRNEYAPAGYTFVPNDGIYSNEPITSMQIMFAGNATFNDPDIVLWDVSTVTDMNTMFANCTAFNQPIGTWDVSNVTNMGGMFYGANSTSFNQPIGGWDVSNVTNLDFFFGVPNDEILDRSNMNLSGWSVPNITTEPQEWIPLGGDPIWGATQTPLITTWTNTNNAYVFIYSQNDLRADALIDWGDGTREVLVGGEFNNNVFHNFSSTGTYTVTIRGYLPNYQGNLAAIGGNQPLPPSNTGLTAVTEWNSTTVSLAGAFEAGTALTSVPDYLPPSVVNTRYMFDNAVKINDPNIAFWDVSNVTNMDGMFDYAVSFNQDLSNWCVSNIPSEPSEFSEGVTGWTQPKPVWGTCPTELSFAGYAEIAEDGQGVYIYSEGGSADNMRDVLAQLGVGSTFEWTSPYNPDPNQKYVATLLSENIGIGSSWRFNISTVPRPAGSDAPYFAYWIDEIFIDRPI
jgi:surface protein